MEEMNATLAFLRVPTTFFLISINFSIFPLLGKSVTLSLFLMQLTTPLPARVVTSCSRLPFLGLS